jgi:hypothetical protein
MMSAFREKLVSLKESMILDAAIEAENLSIEPFDEVLHSAELVGTMVSCSGEFRNPLTILLDREARGEFHWHDSITGLAA